MKTPAKEIVTRFIESLNQEDFDTALTLLHSNMTFEGVLGTRNGSDAYMADMKKMKLKYRIRELMSNGDNIAVFYDVQMGGKDIFSAGWYQVHDGKIQRFRVVFDPRPLLQKTGD